MIQRVSRAVVDQVNDCQANIWRNLSATYSPLTPAIFGDDGQVIVAIKMYLVDIINLVRKLLLLSLF
jgi:hypothetical protein